MVAFLKGEYFEVEAVRVSDRSQAPVLIMTLDMLELDWWFGRVLISIGFVHCIDVKNMNNVKVEILKIKSIGYCNSMTCSPIHAFFSLKQ